MHFCTNLGCPSCEYSNENWDCCSVACPCIEGEGDCDSDSECVAGLYCGSDNCGAGALSSFDCCVSRSRGDVKPDPNQKKDLKTHPDPNLTPEDEQ